MLKFTVITKIAQKPFYLFFLSLIFTGVGLGTSNSLMSWGFFGMLAALVWSMDWKGWAARLKERKDLWGLMAMFFLFCFGFIHSENTQEVWQDLRVKLPLLVAPLLMLAFPRLPLFYSRLLLHLILAGTVVVCLIGVGIYAGIVPREVDNYRKISPFISHIRLSTLVVWSVFALGWMLIFRKELLWLPRWAGWLFLIFLAGFLLLLKSLTGLVVFFVVFGLVALALIFRKEVGRWRWPVIAAFLAVFALVFSVVYSGYQSVRTLETVSADHIPFATQDGNLYKYWLDEDVYINGYHVYSYVANHELADAWEKRSEIPIDSLTDNGYRLRDVLIRFLASKGWRKNRAAVEKLSEAEIAAVKKGITNHVQMGFGGSLRIRVHQTIDEYFYYLRTGNPNNQSLSTRMEIWKHGLRVSAENRWTGVGTGDVREALKASLVNADSQLSEDFIVSPHEQYLSVWMGLGLPGLIVFLICLLWPLVYKENRSNFLFIVLLCITLVAMTDEDTLETQAGTTQMVFLYVLTLAGFNFNKPRA